MSARVRLVAALSVSGLVLTAFSVGIWAVWPAQLLWAVPFLIGMRVLPLAWGLPLAFVVGSAGRLVASMEPFTNVDADLFEPVLASALVMPLFVLDRFVFRALPRTGFLVWPFGFAWLFVVVGPGPGWSSAEQLLAPYASVDVASHLASRLDGRGFVVATFLSAIVAQGFATIGSIHHGDDPVPPLTRDNGALIAGICAFVVAATAVIATVLS